MRGSSLFPFPLSSVKSIFEERLRPLHFRPPLQNGLASSKAIKAVCLLTLHPSMGTVLAVCEQCVQEGVYAVQTEVQW